MKEHLNTLFVTTQGAYLSKIGENVVVKVAGEVCHRVSVNNLGGIVCFGNVDCSPYLMGFCAEKNVFISFLSERGRFLARVQGPLRREQYLRADDPEFSTDMARYIIAGKIANCRNVLTRALKDHRDKINAENVRHAVFHLGRCLLSLEQEKSLDNLRKVEGYATHRYFSVFSELILTQKDTFPFEERTRRPPLDPVNCLLSFAYSLLDHDIRSALESVGLDPTVGYLHRDQPGRPGLAMDLMEEFRPFIVDRLVLSLINFQRVHVKGFNKSDTGAVLMDDETRRTLLVAYQEQKLEEFFHPFLDEKITIKLLFHVQAMLLSRYLCGDLDQYQPFIYR